MNRFRLHGLLLLAIPAMLTSLVHAQEMRVYTTVRNLAALGPGESADRAPVVARSLTLFHAGKVYDYVEAAKEVTVFEPSHHRFTLLNERRRSISSVAQDEVRQFLSLVEVARTYGGT